MFVVLSSNVTKKIKFEKVTEIVLWNPYLHSPQVLAARPCLTLICNSLNCNLMHPRRLCASVQCV